MKIVTEVADTNWNNNYVICRGNCHRYVREDVIQESGGVVREFLKMSPSTNEWDWMRSHCDFDCPLKK